MKILIMDGTPGFTIDRIKKKPTGGILNSLIILSKYLGKNHKVYVSCSIKKLKKVGNVTYMPLDHKDKIPKWDVVIFNRNNINNKMVAYSKQIGAKLVWWLHDIVDFRYLQDGSYKHIDKIIALSEYCKDSYSKFYDIPEEKFVVIPNGVDKKIFYPGTGKRKKRLIMASALIKGHLPIEHTWNNVKRNDKNAELYVYSSQALHGIENDPAQKQFLEAIESQGAMVQAPVKQEILAKKMRESWALLMPNTYPEICSNLLLQARACGLPVIASNIGANPEFIENNNNSVLTEYYPHDIWLWVKKYAEKTVDIMNNEKLHKVLSNNAPKGIMDWDEVGAKWEKVLKELK